MTSLPSTTHWSPGFRLCGVYVGEQAQVSLDGAANFAGVMMGVGDSVRYLRVEAITVNPGGGAEAR